MYKVLEDFLGFFPQEFVFIIPILFLLLVLFFFYILFVDIYRIWLWIKKCYLSL